MPDSPHFDIHPLVVLKLGEELIADEFTAIVEVAKNAYDAGAARIRIKIDTENVPDDRFQSKYPAAVGTFSIWDDGAGMDAEDIERGWLFIAYSRKRDMKREAQVRKRLKRVPLGDKGIGRLGLQRIGDHVEVFTSTGEGVGYHVAFSWKDFEVAETLSKVPVTIETPTRKLRTGTEILVSGLKSPDLWKGQLGRDRLQSKLSQMVSPFDELRECELEVSLNGSSLDLAQFSRRVLAVAEQHFSFSFDNEILKIKGEFTAEYLRLAAESRPAVSKSIEEDGGEALVEHLCSGDAALAGELEFGKRDKGRIVAKRNIELGSLGNISLETALVGGAADGNTSGETDTKRVPVSPGPFTGEFFHFDRRERASGFERANDFKAFLDTQRGVRIYRNGFAFGRYGIDGADWLGLGAQWSTGPSWFGLKPSNIIGFIRISAADNPRLEEKTDREGLTDSPAAANFLRLVQEVTDYANRVNAYLRRGIVTFAKKLELAGTREVNLEPEAVSRSLGQGQAAAKRVKTALLSPQKEKAPTAAEVEEVERALSMGQALSAELERIKLELQGTMALAGLGLTAEALTHEIANIVDRLSQRVKVVSNALDKLQEPDARMVEFVEHVRGSVAALRKQLAHLAPSLRFARERKEQFDAREFLKQQADFFSDRFREKGIELKVDLGDEPLALRTSRGKLTQVVDNLLLNSEYWLEEQLRRDSKAGAVVKIRVRPPHVLISDTGPGVDQTIEPRLFQPFVTLKPKGRGLGLYIVRQLLDSLGCSVSLKGDRNQRGRRYIFDLDLSGAVDGDEEDD